MLPVTESKHITMPLSADAEALLAAIVESSDDGIVSKTLQGIVTSWNKGAERLFGFTAEEMIGQSIMRIIPSELRHEETMIQERVSHGEKVELYETERIHKSGARLQISLTVWPVLDAEGLIIGAAKVAHNLTARRRGELAFNPEARLLETLNQLMISISGELDLERVVQRVTDAGRETAGAEFGAFFYNAQDADQSQYRLYTLSGVARELFADFPMPRETEVFAPTFRGEGPVRSDDIRSDLRFRRNPPNTGMPPGHLPVCSYLAVSVKSRSGEVIGALLFGHSQPGVFSQRAEELVVGLAAQAAVAIDNARLFQQLQRELAARDSAEAALRDSDSKLRQSAQSREQLLESERAARAEAERLSRLKDEFLSTLSHELRTPLNAIQGWTAVMKQGSLSEKDHARGLEAIERNVRAQTRLIGDLLDMNRIVSGKLYLEARPVQLQEVVQAAIEAVRPSADTKHIRLRSLIDADVGPVRGDPDRLIQVLWNLLSNAIKFTPEEGRVQVSLERLNSHGRITVEDNGIGIRSEFLPFVFDRFRQADATTTRQYGGLGLGLAIVKSLVELHGGSISVKSAGEHTGSTFVVDLPLQQPHQETVSGSEDMELHGTGLTLPRLESTTVLVVDDDADGRTMVARILEEYGATVLSAADAAGALQYLAEQPVDVLVSDIGMPIMDGYEMIRGLRGADLPTRNIPAIALTAYARPEDRERALLSGFQLHLAKPVEARELVAGVAALGSLRR